MLQTITFLLIFCGIGVFIGHHLSGYLGIDRHQATYILGTVGGMVGMLCAEK